MNITYGMNSGLLYNIFNAFGEQSRTHILPVRESMKSIRKYFEMLITSQYLFTVFDDITDWI